MSPALAFLGISILGTWGLASLGLIVGGVFLIFFPGDTTVAGGSDSTVAGIILLVFGLISGGLMQMTVMPLLGIDPPFPLSAKKIVPREKLTTWAKVGPLRELPDGLPKEVRLLSRRVTVVRMGDTAYALGGLCSHARLPLAGFPGSPVKPYPVRDGCVMCPFHGARFDVETGKVVRQPFDSQFNNEHPFLGRLQSKLFAALSKIPAPPRMPKPSMHAEDMQTYPVRVEGGDVLVGLPK